MVSRIRFDASTACQLKCPSCPTASGEIQKQIGTGFLKFEKFQQFLKDSPQREFIEQSNWGEIFLNPVLLTTRNFVRRTFA